MTNIFNLLQEKKLVDQCFACVYLSQKGIVPGLMHLGPTLSPFGSKLPQVDGDFTASFSLCPSITCPWHGSTLRRSEIVTVLLFHHHPQCHHLLCRISSPMGALNLWQSESDVAKTCQHISSLNSRKKKATWWGGGESFGSDILEVCMHYPFSFSWPAGSILWEQFLHSSCFMGKSWECPGWVEGKQQLQDDPHYPRASFQAMD